MRVLYAKNGGALAVEAEKEASFDFLFQHIEFRCGEELTEGDLNIHSSCYPCSDSDNPR